MRNYEDYEVIRLAKELVAIESTNVGKFEKEIGNFIAEWLERETGLPVIKDEFAPERFNVVCVLPGKVEDPAFVSMHHMDVVPAGTGWETDPFRATIVGNKMYGRGTADMKSGLAVAMITFRDMVKLAQSGKEPKRSLVFIATGDEEGDAMMGAMKALESGYVTGNSFVLDHEPTNNNIYVAHKGKTWFKITAIGASAHGSFPWVGVDAISGMAEIVRNIRNRVNELPCEDESFGRSSVCFGTINGGLNTNMVAESCTVTLDMRFPPNLTNEDTIKLVEEACADACKVVEGLKTSIEVVAQRPCVKQDNSSVLLAKLQEIIEEVTGKRAETPVFTGYTDTGVVAAETGNINSMSYGIVGDKYHEANEWVDLDSVLRLYEISRKIQEEMVFNFE